MEKNLIGLLTTLVMACGEGTTNVPLPLDSGIKARIADASAELDMGATLDSRVNLDTGNNDFSFNNCPIPRGECLETLGDYPYPFNQNPDETAVVYGGKCGDSLAVPDIVSGLPDCSNYGGPIVSTDSLTSLDVNIDDYFKLDKNIISVGGPWCNRVTARLLDVEYPTQREDLEELREGVSRINLRLFNGEKMALLVYGWDNSSTRLAARLLRDYMLFRERLEISGLECSDTVEITGTTGTF